ncbi:uncharacterized protein LAJ45_08568 [Morchella importuna]|uniref:uncharacterized protein n=1 Tax=Morchella importuna TaxID=1174673 RepID=UPI001E8D5E05|nr:uncharacterized protein LAJ45_08568 [Morchella importuna]KAH8147412.1 hypothetical protein LAJ45_08568 [Morchella importuna]
MATRRRIMKELDDMAKDTSSGMHATPLDPSDMTHLQGRFKGPPGTPYEGGEFVIDIKLPDNYPFMPPKMKFETKVWHPNVSSQTGAICLDTLSQKWSPDAEVAQMMLATPQVFKARAREWAVRYAGAPRDLQSSGSTGGMSGPTPAQQRAIEYGGYDQNTVDGFANMGFPVALVVRALGSVGARKKGPLSEEEAARVVEILLS